MVTSKDVDRLFLQAALSRRHFSQGMGKLLWKKSVEAVKGNSTCASPELQILTFIHVAVDNSLEIEYKPTDDAWLAYVQKLNDSMNTLNLEIVLLHDETTGLAMHALVRASSLHRRVSNLRRR